MQDIADKNVEKIRDRWQARDLAQATFDFLIPSLDSVYPINEQLPRKFIVDIVNVVEGKSAKTILFMDGDQIGDPLTDNAYESDGYRYHDVFHFAYAAVLEWSPITRSLMKRKRKSDPLVDEVEDGGRAKVIEEGISAAVFTYAQDHAFLKGVRHVDSSLIKGIKNMTNHLEVAKCSTADWERAILMGFDVWRDIKENNGGRVVVDLDLHLISYQDIDKAESEIQLMTPN